MSSRVATSGLMVVALTIGLVNSAYAQRIAFARGLPRSLPVGKTARVTATVRGLENTAVRYVSSDTTILRVSSAGIVTALRPGTATITAISVGDTSVRTPPVTFQAVQPQNVNLLINEVCPNQDSSFFRDSLPITADLPYIHEFHDCQRLIANGTYRALIGIFAHAHVDTFPPAFFRGGRLAAVIINFRTKKDTILYRELDLRPGTNCLILNWIPERRRWEAAIIHQSTVLAPRDSGQYRDCPDTLRWDDVPAARKGRLTVRLQTGVGPDDKPGVPPVARWDWDRRRGHNYLGIKCGQVWCEIGLPGFTPSVALKTETKRDIIKGYYDEQYLADTAGKLSRVFGTVRPGRDIARRDGEWHHGADIRIWISPADHAIDRSVFDFYRNEYRLSTELPLHTAAGDLWMRAAEGSGTGDYGLMINGHMGPGWKMKFHHHPGYASRAGTVRWRWNERDESIWRYCEPEGCCESRTTSFQ